MAALDKELTWFETEFAKLSTNDRAQLLEQFRVEHARHPGERHFCSILEAPISVPCRLDCCSAHMKNPALMNCGLFHRGTSKRSYVDIAKTFNVPEEQAKSLIAEAIRKLRLASLDETISQKKINRYYLVPANVCMNCGGVAPKDAQFTAGKFKYCSRACAHEFPPVLVKLEHYFKTDIRNVLSIALVLFRSVILISTVLRIQRSHLLKFYERYLGVKPHSFGVDVADLIDLLRKQHPSPSIEDFIKIDPAKLKAKPEWNELARIGASIALNL